MNELDKRCATIELNCDFSLWVINLWTQEVIINNEFLDCVTEKYFVGKSGKKGDAYELCQAVES